MHREQYERARRAALKILTYRARTEYEIGERLFRKGFDRDTIKDVIKNLRDYKMLDDDAFADRYVAQRPSWPRAVISGKLKGLGVREAVIEKALEGLDPEAEFRIALSQALNRRKRRGDGYPLENVAAFLRQRGFSQEAVERVCVYLEDLRPTGDLDI